jgi:hypothetical protein
MRVRPTVVSGVLLLSVPMVSGCSPTRASTLPSAVLQQKLPDGGVATPNGDTANAAAKIDPADSVPKVMRRIVAEQRDLVARTEALATELPDPTGRQRATTEANELAAELARISAGIDGADSQVLDNAMNQLQLLETRITLLHEKLRTATLRTTAVLIE